MTIARAVRGVSRRLVVGQRRFECATPIPREPDAPLNRRDPSVVIGRLRRVDGALPELERAVVVAEALSNTRQIRHELRGALRTLVLSHRQRGGQVVGRFSIRVLRRCVAPGGAKILDRLRGKPARVAASIVKRELAGVRHRPRTVQRFERFGDRAVQRARSSESELGVQCLLQQRVGEVVDDVASVLALSEHVGAAKLIDRRDEHIVICPARRLQLVVRRSRSEHGRDVGKASRTRRQLGEPCQHRLSNRRRNAKLIDVPSNPTARAVAQLAALDERTDGLSDEEWIAARPAMQSICEVLRSHRVRTEHAFEQFGDRRHLQRGEAKTLSVR